jgi:hypothetical protein
MLKKHLAVMFILVMAAGVFSQSIPSEQVGFQL